MQKGRANERIIMQVPLGVDTTLRGTIRQADEYFKFFKKLITDIELMLYVTG